MNPEASSVEASEVHAAISVGVITGHFVEESCLRVVFCDAEPKFVSVSHGGVTLSLLMEAWFDGFKTFVIDFSGGLSIEFAVAYVNVLTWSEEKEREQERGMC